MATEYEPDRFDDIPSLPSRRAAHRAPRRAPRWLLGFGLAALATGILTAAGVVVIFMMSGRVTYTDFEKLVPVIAESTPTPTPTPTSTGTPTVAPIAADAARVTVRNSSGVNGLAAKAAAALTSSGWTVVGTDTAVELSTITVVYYASDDMEFAAKQLVTALGTGAIEKSDTLEVDANGLVASLGSDYVLVAPAG
jgi:hypothetical protein